MSSTFETLASTREDYMAVIERLKASAPNPKKSSRVAHIKRGEAQHSALISSLEERVPAIDAEIAVSCIHILAFRIWRHPTVERLPSLNFTVFELPDF